MIGTSILSSEILEKIEQLQAILDARIVRLLKELDEIGDNPMDPLRFLKILGNIMFLERASSTLGELLDGVPPTAERLQELSLLLLRPEVPPTAEDSMTEEAASRPATV